MSMQVLLVIISSLPGQLWGKRPEIAPHYHQNSGVQVTVSLPGQLWAEVAEIAPRHQRYPGLQVTMSSLADRTDLSPRHQPNPGLQGGSFYMTGLGEMIATGENIPGLLLDSPISVP